jgi:hypothetical protein
MKLVSFINHNDEDARSHNPQMLCLFITTTQRWTQHGDTSHIVMFYCHHIHKLGMPVINWKLVQFKQEFYNSFDRVLATWIVNVWLFLIFLNNFMFVWPCILDKLIKTRPTKCNR